MQKAFIQTYSEVLPQLHRWPRESQLYYGYGRINAYKALKALKDDLKPSQIIENEFSPKTPIPDGDLLGITSIIQIDDKGKIESVEAVSIDISHAYQGDLMVSLISPDNTIIPLH